MIGPNASLTAREAAWFFAGTSVLCLGIAAPLAVAGLWPVLPFAGLELLALGAALLVVLRRNRYREVIDLDAEHITVQFGVVGEGVRASCEWPRTMTRVWLERGPYPSSASVLVLSCGAQRLRIGTCLTDAERRRLAARLKELIHPAWPARAPQPAPRTHEI